MRQIEKLSKSHTIAQMALLIEGVDARQVKGIAKYFGFSRRRRSGFCPTGLPVIDELLLKASAEGLTLVEIDRRAGIKGRYFGGRRWENSLNGEYVARAVEALGGELYVEWED